MHGALRIASRVVVKSKINELVCLAVWHGSESRVK